LPIRVFLACVMMPRPFRILLATLSMYFVTHLFVFAFLPLATMASLLDPGVMLALRPWFMRTLFAIVGKELNIVGRENVSPDGAYVIISNYPSFYAGFALMGVFPTARIVAHAFTSRVPLLGQALRRVGAVFVQPGRGGAGKAAIDTSLRDPAPIDSIIILPEGARTPNGRICRFRRGFLYILRQAGLDLLPVTLNGFYQLKPVRRLYADPDAQIEMIIHPPVDHVALAQMSDQEVLSTAHDLIASAYRP
jgi:1-acyl-sn-glycerol-3-phosphate acyltransferase